MKYPLTFSSEWPGSRHTIACPFTYDSPNLDTGFEIYQPTAGDLLHEAWITVSDVWDGTTPKADCFIQSDEGLWFADNNSHWDAETKELVERPSVDLASVEIPWEEAGAGIVIPPLFSSLGILTPWVFAEDEPIKMIVTQTGERGGGSPGSTRGAAIFYLDVSRPQEHG